MLSKPLPIYVETLFVGCVAKYHENGASYDSKSSITLTWNNVLVQTGSDLTPTPVLCDPGYKEWGSERDRGVKGIVE